MSIRTNITQSVAKVKSRNKDVCANKRQNALNQLKSNLQRGESIAANKGIIQRYHNTKPAILSQMQQALLNAV